MKKAYAKLKKIEKQTGHVLDWNKIKTVVAETRGIPVVVSVLGRGGKTAVTDPVRLRHPATLSGQPQVPEWRTDAWYVLAADFDDAVDAKRLAAILNHQGPQIPARVLSTGGRHRVLAGPFSNSREAAEAVKRLRIDLEMEGVMVAPVAQGSTPSGN
ncbi:SPOR domain-containing protein [Desulfosarcina cetonica]|uniref:SPOR domain-containing protein n=1 Tax=Desulfosarcina cetonica TaxID=90730 RepID=UPI001C494124|nr:SPOR domain-containing protein [Desulfosarcina cetonica]